MTFQNHWYDYLKLVKNVNFLTNIRFIAAILLTKAKPHENEDHSQI